MRTMDADLSGRSGARGQGVCAAACAWRQPGLRRVQGLAFALLFVLALPAWAQGVGPSPVDPAAEATSLPSRPAQARESSRPSGPPSFTPWSSLSPAEREQLQPFAAQWEQLPPDRQARLRRAAARWAELPPARRAEMQERFRRWQALTPEQRQQLRERFRDFRNMSPEQQDRVRRGMKRFRDLPPDERARLREEFGRMSPPERRAFLQGAAAERRALARERWLHSLPEAEREPMRRLLDSLTPEQRRAFRHLLSGTPPEQQAALRKAILAMDAAALAERLSGD